MRCQRCLIPDTRPDTAFVDGVCSACISYDRRAGIDWRERLAQLKALIARHDGRCLVPSSGGKDSTAQVLKLIELGAKPIAVTATTCHLTGVGRANIDNLARFATTVEITPNREVRRKLNRQGLELVGDISWPEHASIFSTPFRVACAVGIPLMFYGESPQNQYGGPPGSEEAKTMTRRWTSEFGGFNGLRTSDFVGTEGITATDMADYELPAQEEMDDVGVEAHFLGQYLPWDSHENARLALDHGFTERLPYEGCVWPFENVDNAQTGIHDFFCYLKYGYGRAAAQLSVDIRAGRTTREEAMKIVEEKDGLFPVTYMGIPAAKTLNMIGVTPDRFVEICNEFLNRDIFEGDVEWGRRPEMAEVVSGT